MWSIFQGVFFLVEEYFIFKKNIGDEKTRRGATGGLGTSHRHGMPAPV